MKAAQLSILAWAGTLAAALVALPAGALAGPDDPAASRAKSARLAPPGVTLQQSTTSVTRDDDETFPIQPLRQREESVHFRIAYKLLNDIGFTGTEGDRQPIGYQQLYGPPPMFVYQSPPAPRPRRTSPANTSPADGPEKSPVAPPVSAAPAQKPDPAATAVPSPAPPAAANAGAPAAEPADGPDAGLLPDASQQAAQTRNSEMLSYFRRSNPVNRPPSPEGAPGGGGGGPGSGVDPGYLQAPPAAALPPSSATYRVVPK